MDLPIFCINMNEATERWDRMQKRFEKYNLNVTRWVASTPETLGDYPVYKDMKPGEKGCGLSHYRLWEHIVSHNIQKALILEDDACFRCDWIEILLNGFKKLDKMDPEWDCILLNSYDDHPIHERFIVTNGNCCTGGYVITLRAAQLLVNTFKQCVVASDWMTLHLQRRGHTYMYFPWLVIQDGLDTYIQGDKLSKDVQRVNDLLRKAGYDRENYDL